MKSSSLRSATVLTASALLSLLLPASFASASQPASLGLPAAADVIASGVITDTQGQADPNGEVYALALPDQSSLIGQPAGAPIPLTVAGFARTDAQGNYAVTAQPGDLMPVNGQHGYVNLQVIAVSGGQAAQTAISVTPAGTGWEVAGGTSSVPSLSFNFATRAVAVTPPAATADAPQAAVSLYPITPAAPTADLQQLRQATNYASASVPASPGIVPGSGTCLIIAGTIYYNIKEHFLTAETFGGKIPETITEGTNSSSTHTLGVAYSYSGNYGTWGANGTMSLTDSHTNQVSSTFTVPYTVYNRVNYRQYNGTCGGHWRRPYSFYDLLTNDGRQVGVTWQYHCTPHRVGDIWISGYAKDATVAGGVNLGILNVSAQAGYGTSVQLQYHFRVAGEVCGNSTSGPLNSSLVEADPY